jgi:hypothetical protein
MFWKIIRWGGTAVITLLLLAAALLSGRQDEISTPAQPAATEAQPSKNFNL